MLEGQETDRLEFRFLKESDFNTWLNFFINSSASGFIGMQDIASPYDQCVEWFNRVINRYEKDLGGMNVLIDKKTGLFIGQCGLLIQEVDNTKELEIGYSIMPEYWNMGYATEAAKKCRDAAFKNNFTDTLISIIHIKNTGSERVALKNGMVKTKQTKFKKMPVNIFRITRSDWLQIKDR